MIRQNIQILLILLIMIFTFIVNNDVLEPNIMESRNLTTAREILEKGNWLEPTMNGELRLEKPPLPTWISAFTIFLFGEDNMALLRLPAALAAILMIFFLYRLTKEISDDKDLPFLVAGTAATSFYIFFMARDVSWDIYCHSFMVGAIWLIHRALKKDGQYWREFIGAGILLGLCFLSKGPVSFYTLLLPYLIMRIICYGWKDFAAKRKPLIIMALIMLVIGFWWPVYIYITNPDYSAYVALKESTAWIDRNTRPFYHYWSFPVQSGIWTIIAAITLIFPYAKDRVNKAGNYWFIAGWVWIAVLLLSLFPEKKERYLLPVLIPLSILTACYISYLISAFKNSHNSRSDTILLWINGILMSLISIAIPFTTLFLLKGKTTPGFLFLILLFIVFLGLAFIFIKALMTKKPYLMWQGMVGLVMFTCLLLLPLIPKIIQSNPDYRSYKELKYRGDLISVPFYFNGEIPGKFIEVVWNSGHEVKAWNPLMDQNLPVEAPLLFMSHEQPFLILNPLILAKYEVEIIGHFDGNMELNRGNAVLSNYVTIIRQRRQ
jgi:4-amino-4-deoxy-L-arabinose transferase-like glycosyltransferase